MEIRTDTCMYNILPWHITQGLVTPDSQIDHNKENSQSCGWILFSLPIQCAECTASEGRIYSQQT